jgi:hypothetical protein
MTAERMAALVGRWVRFYTRRLPGEIAQRRVDEIDADLHDQIAHGRAQGTSDPRIALGILSRMLRGLAADLSWRTRHANAAAHPSTLKDAVKTSASLYRSAVRVAAAVFGEADDAPGLVLLGILLIASACALGARTAQRSR